MSQVNQRLKNSAAEILKGMQIDISDAINSFLAQIVKTKKMPVKQIKLTENGYTEEFEKEMLKEIEWTRKYGKVYDSAEEMHDDILNDKHV